MLVFEILYFVSAFLKHYSEKSCINQAKLFHFGHILYFYGEKKIEVYANRAYKAKWLCIQYPFSAKQIYTPMMQEKNFHILKQIVKVLLSLSWGISRKLL